VKIPRSTPEHVEKRLQGAVRPRQKALSQREWKFVWEWVSGDGAVSLKEAAIRAGYKPSGATEAARQLTDANARPDVVAAIHETRRDLRAKYGTTLERHMKDLMDIRDRALAANNFSAAVAAEYRRGQALGTIYVDRKEIKIGTIDTMSKEEVMRKLEELRQMYEPQPAIEVEAKPIPVPQLEVAEEMIEEAAEVAEEVVEEEDEALTIREGLRHVERTRKHLVSKAKEENYLIRNNEVRVASQLGDTRLLDRSPLRREREDI
jgi:NifB/MoaA-like Fe-S oxidoreductase